MEDDCVRKGNGRNEKMEKLREMENWGEIEKWGCNLCKEFDWNFWNVIVKMFVGLNEEEDI